MSARRRMTIKRLRKYRCRECGVAQGQLHVLGCWREAARDVAGRRSSAATMTTRSPRYRAFRS